jgi:uncharacterized protein (DUF1501 family)
MILTGMQRRQLLQAVAALPLIFLRPFWMERLWAARANEPLVGRREGERILMLVELQGGNDGLNTCVPFGDSGYYRARPQLAIPRSQVLQLTPKLGFHPALTPLMSLWDVQELALVTGVGYSNPNRSHFRSIEIWETASDSEELVDQGWLSKVFEQFPLPPAFTAEGILLGKGDAGPLSGGKTRTISLHDPEQFLLQAGSRKPTSFPTTNRALAHILTVQHALSVAAADLQGRIAQAKQLGVDFPASKIGKQLEVSAKLIAARIPVAVIKVTQGSFDTHAGQLATHYRLLDELAQALVAFRMALLKQGAWNDVLSMSYSEFGRRVEENASHGTDHGTAAVHLLMGGRVKGGLYGTSPLLTDLQNGDLKYTTDYRSLYATVIEKWWGLPPVVFGRGRHPAIDCLS